MCHSILDMRRFQHTSHLGRQLLTISSKGSLRFCIMSETMRRPIRGRGSCRGISAGKSSSSTAALEAFLRSSWMKSPPRSAKSSGLVARPIAGLSETARPCLVLFGTSWVKSWANIWKLRWNSWTEARHLGLSTGSQESFSLSSWRTAKAVSRRG